MVVDKKSFDNAFQALNAENRKVAYDFMQFLAERQNNDVERFYALLPEVDEPMNESEIEQFNGNTEWSSLENV